MRVTRNIAEMRSEVVKLSRPLGFVPTMGALHAGHMRLIEVARKECASVVASLFVNPLQFGEHEDLERYPRDADGDKVKFADAGVDALFLPNVSEIYPEGFSTRVDVGKIGTVFEGAIRPDHFRGVATVVTKLLNVVQPDIVYLGQKDAQQTAVLRKLVRDLSIPVEVRIVPTVRETDELAMSSRNTYLDERERAAAPALYHALEAIQQAMSSGVLKKEAIKAAGRVFGHVGVLDYLEVVDADTFEPIETLRAPAFIIGAARFGNTRLIDNLWIAA